MTPPPEPLNAPVVSTAIRLSPGSYPKNVRAANVHRSSAYPWLLVISTLIAGVFCLLYITKPVIITAPASAMPAKVTPTAQTVGVEIKDAVTKPAADPVVKPAQEPLLPAGDQLPGDPSPELRPASPTARPSLPAVAASSPTEETNLRIQHILTAEAPGGHLDRIDLEVPVLYHSRNLRWTPEDVTRARELMIRLMDYQEKSRALRLEGAGLLDAWNALINKSIPTSELRADSPSLPSNQQDAADTPLPEELISEEVIQLEPAEK